MRFSTFLRVRNLSSAERSSVAELLEEVVSSRLARPRSIRRGTAPLMAATGAGASGGVTGART